MRIKESVIIILCFLLIALLLFLIDVESKKEKFSNNINLNNWWSNSEFSIPFIRKFINTDKDIEAYGPSREEPKFVKDKNKIYFQFSCEPFYSNPELFDINIVPYKEETDNIIIMPFASVLLNMDSNTIDPNTFFGPSNGYDKFLKKRYISNEKKSNFCLFSVSNGDCDARNNFFKKLSEYKRVDSCGGFMNNMEQNCPGYVFSTEYFDFVGKYKFMICFENSSIPNYFTEKLVNAYYSGTIPIYWGCPNIDDYVNMDAILYLKPDYTEEDVRDLIKQIEHLDNNDDAYKAKYENYFFKDGKLPDAFNSEKIKEKINKRLSQL